MFYLWAAGLGEYYRNNVKSEWAVVYIMSCEKIAGCPE